MLVAAVIGTAELFAAVVRQRIYKIVVSSILFTYTQRQYTETFTSTGRCNSPFHFTGVHVPSPQHLLNFREDAA